MIKLIAIDLDGTMYTSNRNISEQVCNAIHTAKDNSILPVIVTGRGRRGAEIALEALSIDIPYICSAGAQVRTGMNGKIIHSWPFHKHSELMHIIKFTREHGAGLIAEPENAPPYWFGPDSLGDILDPLTAKEANQSIRSFSPEIDFDIPLLKVTITTNPDHLEKAGIIVRENCPSIHQVYSGTQYIDLTSNGVNKGSALSALANYYRISPSEIAAIGDQEIDMYMLEYAGLPIAMSNAVPKLKSKAKWIAPGNDEDGVAWAIDKILRQSDV